MADKKDAVVGDVITADRWIILSFEERTNDKGKVRQWIEVQTGTKRTKFTSDVVDLSELPRMVPVKVTASIGFDMWGFNPVLFINQITAVPV